jgi:hypothetical protein
MHVRRADRTADIYSGISLSHHVGRMLLVDVQDSAPQAWALVRRQVAWLVTIYINSINHFFASPSPAASSKS